MEIKNRQKIMVIAAALGVGFLLADKLLITPLTEGWQARSKQIAELTKQVNQGSLLVSRDSVIRDRWEHMRTNTLPADVSFAENDVLTAFERWSKLSGISISSIKPQWKQAARLLRKSSGRSCRARRRLRQGTSWTGAARSGFVIATEDSTSMVLMRRNLAKPR